MRRGGDGLKTCNFVDHPTSGCLFEVMLKWLLPAAAARLGAHDRGLKRFYSSWLILVQCFLS